MEVSLELDINTLFLLVGGILALLATFGLFMKQAGAVRKKNQVWAFAQFPLSWVFTVLAYFFIGFLISYGYHFFLSAQQINVDHQGFQALRFFFLSSVACLVPAIIMGALAERTTLKGQLIGSIILVALVYPLLEGTVWGNLSWLNGQGGIIEGWMGLSAFHDFGGAVTVNMLAGFAALAGILVVGPRYERFSKSKVGEFTASSPLLYSAGNWLTALTLIGVAFSRYAGDLNQATALVPINLLLGIGGGYLSQLLQKKEEWHIKQSPALAGAISVLGGADLFHPLASLVVGFIGGLIFLFVYRWVQDKLHLDDVCGAWALHGWVGLWGGIATGIAGYSFLGGLGGVNILSQLIGVIVTAALGTASGILVFYLIHVTGALKVKPEEEKLGMDVALLKLSVMEEPKKK